MENNKLFTSLDKLINENKSNEIKSNETKSNETKSNETKSNEKIIDLKLIIKKNGKIKLNIIILNTNLNKKIDQNFKEDLINNNNISNKPEWRYYGHNDSKSSDPTRCGLALNPLLPEASVGTTIKSGYYDKIMNKTKKMNDWNSMTYKERSLNKIFNDIQLVCNNSNLKQKIIQEAKSLYKIMSENKISRGNNRKGIIAACVYFACKNCNVPRSTKEISEMFSIKNVIITKGCKKFQEILHYNKQHNKRINKNIIIHSNDFIDRFCNKLNLNNNDIQIIKNISDKAQELKIIYENTPPSIAAGSIYLYVRINKINISKKDISNISKISEVTINKCYKKLEEYSTQLYIY